MNTAIIDTLAKGSVEAFNLGIQVERERIIERLIENRVIRVDALGDTVFVNCDTLEVEYLGDALINGKSE